MNESNSIEIIDRTNLTDQTKYRLNEISKIENYFNQEIKERKLNSKISSKYVAAFDYIDKDFLSAKSGGISIISFASIIGAPVGRESAKFTLVFSLTTEIIKKILNIASKNKKNMIKFLFLLKVNSIALNLYYLMH